MLFFMAYPIMAGPVWILLLQHTSEFSVFFLITSGKREKSLFFCESV